MYLKKRISIHYKNLANTQVRGGALLPSLPGSTRREPTTRTDPPHTSSIPSLPQATGSTGKEVAPGTKHPTEARLDSSIPSLPPATSSHIGREPVLRSEIRPDSADPSLPDMDSHIRSTRREPSNVATRPPAIVELERDPEIVEVLRQYKRLDRKDYSTFKKEIQAEKINLGGASSITYISRIQPDIFIKETEVSKQNILEYVLQEKASRAGITPHMIDKAIINDRTVVAVMEKIQGRSFLDHLRSRDTATIKEMCDKVIEIMIELAKQNILHADPNNLNFIYDAEAKKAWVIDFGMAKEHESHDFITCLQEQLHLFCFYGTIGMWTSDMGKIAIVLSSIYDTLKKNDLLHIIPQSDGDTLPWWDLLVQSDGSIKQMQIVARNMRKPRI